VTPSEREAFDALRKYAEMEEDWFTMSPPRFRSKYNLPQEMMSQDALEFERRLALEKAREVQAAREEVREGGE